MPFIWTSRTRQPSRRRPLVDVAWTFNAADEADSNSVIPSYTTGGGTVKTSSPHLGRVLRFSGSQGVDTWFGRPLFIQGASDIWALAHLRCTGAAPGGDVISSWTEDSGTRQLLPIAIGSDGSLVCAIDVGSTPYVAGTAAGIIKVNTNHTIILRWKSGVDPVFYVDGVKHATSNQANGNAYGTIGDTFNRPFGIGSRVRTAANPMTGDIALAAMGRGEPLYDLQALSRDPWRLYPRERRAVFYSLGSPPGGSPTANRILLMRRPGLSRIWR